MSAERERVQTFSKLEDGLLQAGDWYTWGPYLSEREWGNLAELLREVRRPVADDAPETTTPSPVAVG